jgi:hypothetical protein
MALSSSNLLHVVCVYREGGKATDPGQGGSRDSRLLPLAVATLQDRSFLRNASLLLNQV